MARPQDSGLRILFVDQITFSSLLRVLALGRSLESIWYFEALAPLSRQWLAIFRKLGLLHAEVRQINLHIGQARKAKGEGEYIKLLKDARAICFTIKREQLANNLLIKTMGSEWDLGKVLFYFEKLVEEEVKLECLRVGLITWMMRNKLNLAPRQSALLIKRIHWFPSLEAYARSKGIRLIGYRSWRFRMVAKFVARMFSILTRILTALGTDIRSRVHHTTIKARQHRLEEGSVVARQPSRATIAIRYWFRKLSFDPTERSEFFWLEGSGIPHSEVLLYDYVTDRPLDAETLDQINARGVRVLGRGPGIPAWHPTPRMSTVFFRTLTKIILGVSTCMARKQWVSPYYIAKLLALAMGYAYWYDFYAANRVRVNVGTLNTSVAQTLALDALNGVSVAYQYSASNILSPTTLLSAGENVQFVLSPVFERLWRSVETPVGYFVHTGFIYDSAIQAVRGIERVAQTKKQLQDNGAHFILCFFDEHSWNRWDIFSSAEDAANDYEYLLNWLLTDSTLGIIFKPKKSTSLFQRIARISRLIDKARQTGRLMFLTSEYIVGDIYPAEAALIADVCIGMLSGTTAALEARLAGVPTVLIDNEGFRSHPFHTWGDGRVVFNSWESLRTAVEQYRAAPEAHSDFGDWSPGLNDLDPFQDGQAGLRMGLYIRWVYEALKQGASKQDSLAIATEKFSQRWGSEHVTFNKVV